MSQLSRDDLLEWQEMETGEGRWRERFEPEAVADLPAVGPFRFTVIRESWDTTGEIPTRVIHEIRVA